MAEFTNIKINDVQYDVKDANAARASDLAAKQDVISDLAAIRSGAALGATAIQQADLATVAISGSYDDLTNKPDIPDIDDAKPLVVTIASRTSGNNTTYSLANVTFNQMVAAYNAGKDLIICDYDGLIHQLSYSDAPDRFFFTSFQGDEGSYTCFEIHGDNDISKYSGAVVPTNTTVNGKALSNNITLSASDVGADVFVINIESDGNDGYTCDKTNAEIYAAWQAGRNIVLISLGECLYKLNALPSQTFCEFGGEQYDDIGGYRYYSIFTNNGQQKVVETYIYFQEQLVSGTNIKTINNQSLLGSGNLTASDIGALPSNTHIPADQVQSNWNETNTSSKAYIQNKPTIPAAQVNSDWDASSGVAQILNKPTFKTINGESIVGTGDIETGSGDVATAFTITITSTTIEVQPMTGAMMTVGTDVSFQVV